MKPIKPTSFLLAPLVAWLLLSGEALHGKRAAGESSDHGEGGYRQAARGSASLHSRPESLVEIDAILAQQEAVTLDLDHSRLVNDTALDLTVAQLRISRGTLVPTTPVAGQVREWLFLGEAMLYLDPPDAVEEQQLELYTGMRSLRETVTEAVLVLANDDATQTLLRRRAAPASEQAAEQARTLFARWQSSGARHGLGVRDGVFLDALGDPLYASYFAGFFRGTTLGDFLCVVEPDALEQVTVGRFEPIDLTKRQKRKTERIIAKQQRKGRWIGLEVESLGAFENWMSMPLRTADGQTHLGHPGFDIEHYDLDIDLSGRDLSLAGRADLRLRADGTRRGLRFTLALELAVTSVTDGNGRPLYFRQNATQLLVVLPAVPATDETVDLRIIYAGDIIQTIPTTKARLLADTEGWYPRFDITQFATYDMTFRWPAKYQLFAAGTPMEGGTDGADRWQRFAIERPALLASFEVGEYQIETQQAGRVAVTFAFDPTARTLITGDRSRLIDAVGDSIAYFEELFGPYPYDHMTVVTAPRELSQSLPAMLTLSTLMLSDQGLVRGLIGTADEDRRGVIAHEVAHQWWGHTVGWQSYRDQWISEAMANYAAVLYMRNRLNHHGGGPTTGWQRDMLSLTEDGRKIESLGPLVLGARLASGPEPAAYASIVYKKGAVVLDMLARRFGEERFSLVLRRILDAVAGRAISTSDFLSLIERLTDVDLDDFAEQFIYGTGLPVVYYDYAFERLDSGRWLVTGQARQVAPYRFSYQVVRGPQGRHDVARSRIDEANLESSSLYVPVMITVLDPSKPGRARVTEQTGNRVALYHTELRGLSTDLRVELDHEPKLVQLDPGREVFAQFFDRQRLAKQVMLYEGLRLLANRQFEEGEARLRAALQASVTTASGLVVTPSPLALEITSLRLDDGIGRALARLYLDQGKIHSAERALAEAAEARGRADELADLRSPAHPPAVTLLEARLALQKGHAKRAYDLLFAAIRKKQQLSGRESLALLAVAAHEAGEDKAKRRAMQEARALGVDVSVLEGP